jgi:hypothetical protein
MGILAHVLGMFLVCCVHSVIHCAFHSGSHLSFKEPYYHPLQYCVQDVWGERCVHAHTLTCSHTSHARSLLMGTQSRVCLLCHKYTTDRPDGFEPGTVVTPLALR